MRQQDFDMQVFVGFLSAPGKLCAKLCAWRWEYSDGLGGALWVNRYCVSICNLCMRVCERVRFQIIKS